MFKLFLVFALFVILFMLGSALYHMAKNKDQDDRNKVVRALTWRIGLSVAVFAFIILAYFMGWIEPQQVEFLPTGK